MQGMLYTVLTNSKEAKDEVNFLDADTWPEILRQHLEDANGAVVRVRLVLCTCRAVGCLEATDSKCDALAAHDVLATTITTPRRAGCQEARTCVGEAGGVENG